MASTVVKIPLFSPGEVEPISNCQQSPCFGRGVLDLEAVSIRCWANHKPSANCRIYVYVPGRTLAAREFAATAAELKITY